MAEDAEANYRDNCVVGGREPIMAASILAKYNSSSVYLVYVSVVR